jgi:hypothetical protein
MTVDTENYHVDNMLTSDVVQCLWNIGTVVQKDKNVQIHSFIHLFIVP